MKKYIIPAVLFIGFILFTVAVKFVDVQAIGPENSLVGFATVNAFVHNFVGEHKIWDLITDLFVVIALFTACGFAVLGLVQLVKNRSLFKVDREIILLGGFYVLVVILYGFFEKVIINYRPVLEDGILEASYPSSHTMVLLCILGTARSVFGKYIKNKKILKAVRIFCAVMMIFAVAGRILSGVHWFTDILGALFVSAALIQFYNSLLKKD